ncbi:SpoIVB peptidase [Bacillus piscicola]|uniref:SpoIVB peptidase n=1 Tax=Bacillus piscicola TaxID=1632684 RepID=UPI001F0929B2|nr:SpoIVB peptidase [Bacillus piscicola]
MEWGRRLTGILLLLLCMTAFTNHTFLTYLNIPETLTVFESEWASGAENVIKEKLDLGKDATIQLSEENEEIKAAVQVASLPKKETKIKTLPDIRVVPGGDSIGVKLQSNGVMIVGFHKVNDGKKRYSPAKEAGLEAGDRIVAVNGKKVSKPEDIIQALKDSSSSITLNIKRDKEEKKKEVKLYENKEGGVLGAYIRNAASGIGTLTFYDSKSGKFGALGHVIADSSTKKPVVVENGEITRSSVSDIDKGANGKPGEKRATLSVNQEKLGKVTKNSPFGVFGELQPNKLSKKSRDVETMPIAFANEVEKGPAEILTVLEDEKIERFDIEIVQSVPQMQAASKGMIIKVTDKELLEKTNGIIQGMSGSPIIQNGKVVGAVTHVFVNDSTSGYACHIEWMLEEAGINTLKEERKKAG